MHLILLRHGIAAELADLPRLPDGSAPRDAERPLTERGRRRLKKTARALGRLGVQPERVLHSGLLRARETAEIVGRELPLADPPFVEVAALAPGADPAELFRLLPSFSARTILCVGHAPNLDRIVALACGGGARPISALGKAGAACIEISAAAPRSGTLEWLLPPRVLRQLGE